MPTFNVTGSSLTIAAWVWVADFATSDQRLISKSAGTTNYWMLRTSGSRLRFQVRTGSLETLTSTATLPASMWVHVAATYDGATMRLFLNGVQVAARSKGGSLATSASATVNIGRSPSGLGHLGGAIDDLRISARALTAAEIGELYSEPAPPPPPPLSFTDDPLVPGVHSMQLVHITELHTRIDALRLLRGLGAASWTPLVAGSSLIRATHIMEMRTALDAVYAAAGRSAPAYTDSALGAGYLIKAAHIMELRAAVRALE